MRGKGNWLFPVFIFFAFSAFSEELYYDDGTHRFGWHWV